VASQLRSNGLALPEVMHMDRLDEGRELLDAGFLYLFADLGPTHVPHLEVTWEQMCKVMEWTARLHAVFWCTGGGPAPYGVQRLWERGGYWSLDKRPAGEVPLMAQRWQEFVKLWRHTDPSLFERHEICLLGERLMRQAEVADEFLHVHGPKALIHGDLKGAHLFFPRSGDGEPTVIDWQWAGWGCPLCDVAYAIQGVASMHDLQAKGERSLLQVYLAALRTHGIELCEKEACCLYRAACIDYARVVVGYFWVDCTVEEVECERENITELTHTREVEHVLRFIRHIDCLLAEFETCMDTV